MFMAMIISHIRIMWPVKSSMMLIMTGYFVLGGCTYLAGGPEIMRFKVSGVFF